MRFKTFLTEGYQYTFNNVVAQIRDECKPFLRQLGERPMYRGIPKVRVSGRNVTEHDTEQAHFFEHPVNRSPKDSDPEFNWIFNAMMDMTFSEEAIRRKSLFVTGSSTQAAQYGAVHFVFPVGSFQYLWSPLIEDSYEDLRKITDVMQEYLEAEGVNIPSRNFTQLLGKLSEKQRDPHIWSYDLDGKSESQVEDAAFETVKPDTAVESLISRLDQEKTNLYHVLTKAMMDATTELYKDSKEMAKALLSNNEILVYESRGYYAIPADMVYAEVQQRKLRIGRYDYGEMFEFLMEQVHGSGSKEIKATP